MRMILVLAATFITIATTLPVSAQTPPINNGNYLQYQQRDGQWFVRGADVGDAWKPLSKKACSDFYQERQRNITSLLNKGSAFVDPLRGLLLSGQDAVCFDLGKAVEALARELLITADTAETACEEFAEKYGVVPRRVRQGSPTRTKSSASSSGNAKGKGVTDPCGRPGQSPCGASELTPPPKRKGGSGASNSPSTNTGAMDRLGGGSQLPNSAPGSKSAGGNRSAPASSATSTATSPNTFTTAPSRTIDFSAGAGIGRPAAPR